MKIFSTMTSLLLFPVLLFSCHQQITTDNPTSSIDSLKNIIEQLKPGLGEFMLQFELHHDRLAKAIREKNYERANYETDELKETAKKIVQLHITNEKLQQPFSFFYDKYLKAAFENLSIAAENKDESALNTNFLALTNNCNSCHHENNMAFVKIEP
ncbi:MAG: hypothetical protein JST75_08335 [Bacteroidetes bacterium]|nr:hypothetical protein [Bacteroidota bacterium]